jgi:hypothetical protein
MIIMIDYIYAALPFICLMVDMVIQILVARNIRASGMLSSIIAGFSAGFVVLLTTEVFLTGSLVSSLANILAYVAFGYCYFHFINLGETARRIRILRELAEPGEGLDIKGLLRVYNSKEILDKRIARLIRSGQIRYSNGRYYTGGPVLLLSAKIIVAMKLFILGKKSEFD